MAEFIRNNPLLTFAIFLVVIIAGNVMMFIQSKNPDKNIKDWFLLKNASNTLGDPWKKEKDQLNELSERVASLKKENPTDSESHHTSL